MHCDMFVILNIIKLFLRINLFEHKWNSYQNHSLAMESMCLN